MNTKEFEAILTYASADRLQREYGFGLWSKTDLIEGKMLYLIPVKYWDNIPKGYKLYCINHKVEYFDPNKTDNDHRGGCIAYGVLR